MLLYLIIITKLLTSLYTTIIILKNVHTYNTIIIKNYLLQLISYRVRKFETKKESKRADTVFYFYYRFKLREIKSSCTTRINIPITMERRSEFLSLERPPENFYANFTAFQVLFHRNIDSSRTIRHPSPAIEIFIDTRQSFVGHVVQKIPVNLLISWAQSCPSNILTNASDMWLSQDGINYHESVDGRRRCYKRRNCENRGLFLYSSVIKSKREREEEGGGRIFDMPITLSRNGTRERERVLDRL